MGSISSTAAWTTARWDCGWPAWRTSGVVIHEHAPVLGLDAGGGVRLACGERRFDLVVNAAGPWAEVLLRDSGLQPAHGIDWVRGSHIVFDEPLAQACLLQVPGEKRGDKA